jgi:hypothetical protein
MNKELQNLFDNENFPLSKCMKIEEGLACFEIKD